MNSVCKNIYEYAFDEVLDPVFRSLGIRRLVTTHNCFVFHVKYLFKILFKNELLQTPPPRFFFMTIYILTFKLF